MTQEEIAENLLFPIWRCLNADFKDKYKADTWGIFENFVRTSANAPTLPQFYEQLKRLIRIDQQAQYEKQILAVMQAGKDSEILQTIRTECSYVVLLTRALNNQRKELFKNTENENSHT